MRRHNLVKLGQELGIIEKYHLGDTLCDLPREATEKKITRTALKNRPLKGHILLFDTAHNFRFCFYNYFLEKQKGITEK